MDGAYLLFMGIFYSREAQSSTCISSKSTLGWLFHKRLVHDGIKQLDSLIEHDLVKQLEDVKFEKKIDCRDHVKLRKKLKILILIRA